MLATLHLPSAAPRTLTATELASLNPQVVAGHLVVDFKAVAPALRGLLGIDVPSEVLASGPAYLIVVAENAADYGFGPTLSATTGFERLTGVEVEEDEPLLGPLLIIEA